MNAPSLSPSVRLATSSVNMEKLFKDDKNKPFIHKEQKPALLISYAYLTKLPSSVGINYRDWALDSGAFTAYYSGKPIKINDYINACKKLLDTDPTLVEIFSLDDMEGNWKITKANTEALWKAGVEAIPCYHKNEPWDVLKGYAKDYPKVALGGMAGIASKNMSQKQKLEWCGECFSKVWPKKLHGFGCAGETLLSGLPFHSADATNWSINPSRFGRWPAFNFAPLNVRGNISRSNQRASVEHYLAMERRLVSRWGKEMAKLEVKK